MICTDLCVLTNCYHYTDQAMQYHFLCMCVFPATCPDLSIPDNGVITSTYNPTTTPRAVDTMATYSCATGYQMTGLMVRMCTASGWSTGDDPVCTGEGGVLLNSCPVCTLTAICPDLTLSNGVIIYNPSSSPRLEGAMATHFCVIGYQLSSSTTRTCQSDRMWSGSSLTCNSK